MTLTMTDLFSGGGGSSEGMTQASVHVQVAANHWDTAIATHQIEQITTHDVPHLVTYRRNAKARRADAHPLATITAGGNHHGIATLTDEGPRFRMLNNRECARGQGFPDSYEFVGNAKDVKKQIGNAVSVDAARWIGGRVKAALEVAS